MNALFFSDDDEPVIKSEQRTAVIFDDEDFAPDEMAVDQVQDIEKENKVATVTKAAVKHSKFKVNIHAQRKRNPEIRLPAAPVVKEEKPKEQQPKQKLIIERVSREPSVVSIPQSLAHTSDSEEYEKFDDASVQVPLTIGRKVKNETNQPENLYLFQFPAYFSSLIDSESSGIIGKMRFDDTEMSITVGDHSFNVDPVKFSGTAQVALLDESKEQLILTGQLSSIKMVCTPTMETLLKHSTI